jgi:hypothetical protein
MAGKERKPSSATPTPFANARLSVTPASFPPPPAAGTSPQGTHVSSACGRRGRVAIGIAVLMSSAGSRLAPRSDRRPQPVATPPPPRQAAASDRPSAPTESPERQVLKKAQAYAREHPDDLEGQLREFNDLWLLSDKTQIGAEARRAVEDLQARRAPARRPRPRGAPRRDRRPAPARGVRDGEPRPRAAKLRIAGTQWKLAVEKRQRDVNGKIYAALPAPEGERPGSPRPAASEADLDAVLQTVRSWEGSSSRPWSRRSPPSRSPLRPSRKPPPAAPRARPTSRNGSAPWRKQPPATSPGRPPTSNERARP